MYLQPRGEDLLENECSSTTHSTEVNVPEEEAGDNGLQSNDQVVPIDLEECHDEPNLKVVDLECLEEDPEGNYISQKVEGDITTVEFEPCFTQIKDLQEGKSGDSAANLVGVVIKLWDVSYVN